MRQLFIITLFFLLQSFNSFGNTVKIYSCETIKNIELLTVGVVTNYKNFKFQFKRTSKGLMFSSKNVFMMRKFSLNVKISDNGGEIFRYSNGDNKIFTYDEEIFNFSQTGSERINSMTGQCSIK